MDGLKKEGKYTIERKEKTKTWIRETEWKRKRAQERLNDSGTILYDFLPLCCHLFDYKYPIPFLFPSAGLRASFTRWNFFLSTSAVRPWVNFSRVLTVQFICVTFIDWPVDRASWLYLPSPPPPSLYLPLLIVFNTLIFLLCNNCFKPEALATSANRCVSCK